MKLWVYLNSAFLLRAAIGFSRRLTLAGEASYSFSLYSIICCISCTYFHLMLVSGSFRKKKRDPRQVALILSVMCLITGKRLRIVYLDQCVAAPSRSIRLDVTHARLDATEIAALFERLKCNRPSLIELGFAASTSVFEPLNI